MELERLTVCYPKNMEWYSKETLFLFLEQIGKQLLIWVICVNIHIELTAAESFV